MFDDFKVANYSKALVSPELYARHLSKLVVGDIIDGFTVTPGTGLQVVLAPGNALIRYGSSAVASARLVSLIANFNLAIGTADVSNPRIDLVVVFINNSVTLPGGVPTSANLDGKGVAQAKIVPGTPNASPSAPNGTAIQASVGPGNPYTVVAQVRVDAGVNLIASNKITDVRSRVNSVPRFSVHRVAATNSAAGAGAKIPFDTKVFDEGGNFDLTNARFIAPENGDYHFEGLAGNTAAVNTIMYCKLMVNGTERKIGNVANPSNANNRQSISTTVRLSAGDQVELWFIGGGGSVMAIGASNCYFEGFLVARN